MPERIPNGVAKKVVFRAISSADHFTPATSKTIAITISKNAGAFGNPAAGATNATEITSGFYTFDLGTGDTGTNGPLAWRGAGTGIDDVGDVYEVVAATNAGFTALPNAAAEAAGGLYTRGTGAGQIAQDANGNIRVNVDTIKTQTVICAAGVTVLASVGTAATSTAQTGDSYSRLGAPAGASLSEDIAAIQAKTVNLPATPASTTNITAASGVTLAPTTGLGNQTANIAGTITTVTNLTNAPTAGDLTATMKASVENAVWDATAASHANVGSTGKALTDAGAAGNPWSAATASNTGAGTFGLALGTTLQATEAAIKAKTDNLPALPAAVGDIPTATQNADTLLNRDMSAVSDTNARSPLNALRFLRNKWDVSGTALTVKKEDDSTTAWTGVVTASPGADPISGNDPA